MKQAKLTAHKRFAKPVLFGAILVGLAAAFINRHKFFPEVDEIRVREHTKYSEKRQEVLERRQKQLSELAEKKTSS